MPTKTKSGSLLTNILLNSLLLFSREIAIAMAHYSEIWIILFKDGQHIGQDFLFCSEEVDRVAFSLAKWSNSCIKSMPATRSGTE